MNLSEIRKDYIKHTLDFSTTGDDPMFFFRKWLEDAISSEVPEPTAMSLSTVSSQGRPSSRIVLLKGIENEKFVFFSNYKSDKGRHIESNHYVSLLFFWPELERQVRIEGTVEKVSGQESDKYFASRPLQSRISAIVSLQSSILKNRDEIEEKFRFLAEKATTTKISRPMHWGGYSVLPEMFEFWQGRANRLHDRIRFRKSGPDWIKERLAP